MSRRSEHTTKVFVGSLPPNVTADDLRQLFTPYGPIAECDIANRCGFLHLEDKDLAEKAINELNNTTFMGARISVEKGRVKPRGERRMRGGPGLGLGVGVGIGRGAGLGRKRDMGPYSRDAGFGRGAAAAGGPMPPRNGNFRDEYRSYDEYGREYGRFEERYDRRPPMFDDRRATAAAATGYMTDRNAYGNGYERRQFDERSTPYTAATMAQRPYEDNRMAQNGPAGYEDRRPMMTDRRPLLDEQSMNQGQMRQQTYEQVPRPQSDMFSRRDGAPKPISTGVAYERPPQAGSYTSYGNGTTSYATSAPQAAAASYSTGPMNSYNTAMGATGANTGAYGDARGSAVQSAGFADTRSQAPPLSTQGYTGAPTGGYNTAQQAGPAGGGYGDSYGMRAQSNAYDSAYPPLPQQRGFAGGNAPGPHRDTRAGDGF